MTPLDWLIVACYFGLLAALTAWTLKRRRDTAADYFLASRNLAASVVDTLPRRAYDELLRNRLKTDWTTPIANRVRALRGRLMEAPSPREMVISELRQSRMRFTPTRGPSGIVEVAATASNPAVAAEIATAYIEVLQSKTRFFTREESVAVREFLEKQARQVGATVQSAEDALAEFERRRGFVKIDDKLRASLERLNQAEASLGGSVLSEDIARTRLAAIKAQIEVRPPGPKPRDPLVTRLPPDSNQKQWVPVVLP